MRGMKGERAVEENMRERGGGDGVMKEAGKGRLWFEAIARVCVHVASSFLPSVFLLSWCARPLLVSSACSSGSNIGACVHALCVEDKWWGRMSMDE